MGQVDETIPLNRVVEVADLKKIAGVNFYCGEELYLIN